MDQQLNLTKDQQNYYNKIYKKMIEQQSIITQSIMNSLLYKKGDVQEKDIAKYIIEQSIKLSKSENSNINKNGFMLMMKYLTVYQSGKNVKNIDIFTIQTTNLPKFSSRKAKEKKEREMESQLMLSQLNYSQLAEEEKEESKENPNQNNNNQQSNQRAMYPSLQMSIVDANQRKFSFSDNSNNNEDSNIQNSRNLENLNIAQEQLINTAQFQQEKQNEQFGNQSFGNQNSELNEEAYMSLNFSNIQNISKIYLSQINNFTSDGNSKGKKPKIEIRDFIIKEGTYMTKSYILYNIHYGLQSEKVERRFKEFEELNNYLLSKKEYKGLIIPKLPPKQINISQLIGTQIQDSEFQIKRMADLEDYLNKINNSIQLSEDPVFIQFVSNKSSFTQNSQSTVLNKMSQWYNSITSQSLQENSEYLQAMIVHRFNEYYRNDQQEHTKTEEIDQIMQQINKYQLYVDNLQQILYEQYQLEKQKREKIQSLSTIHDQPFEQIQELENYLVLYSTNYKDNADKKKEVWKEFRSIYSQIESAKQSHDMLLQQIKHQQFLNQLKSKKVQNQQPSNQEQKQRIKEIDDEILESEKEIVHTKILLKEELSKFLENLKKKIRESLEIFQSKTIEEFDLK
ncbi:PX domain protein (macronuclear) [Tetrahymena thermophila SB210]|uniref:PX domain protein n=1 Tax=Tetrahymena thermophila (strain SB210) TaxID=312017 RepID=Q22UX5_TETTS|nr:PX domain protein [Tetrahymena thermophila SB210]EAR89173.2 PX domain protein [Tetrahymena thermophila SB210]|eukprot:XP_001009418.2 PX domain protein [Tetrahymena thermophila SB210]